MVQRGNSKIDISIKQLGFTTFAFGLLTGLLLTGIFAQVLNTDKPGKIDKLNDNNQNPTVENSEQNNQIQQLNLQGVNAGTGEGSFEWLGGKVNLEGNPYLGSEDARFIMVTYEDFDCPYCGQHNRNGFKNIVENQVKNGTVQYFYKHYNTQQGIGKIADQATRCALNQDEKAFWQMKNKIYQNQDKLNSQNIKSNVLDYAEQIGTNSQQLKTCINQEKTLNTRKQHQQEAENFNYQLSGNTEFPAGTPAFLLYDTQTENFETMHGGRKSEDISKTIKNLKLEV